MVRGKKSLLTSMPSFTYFYICYFLSELGRKEIVGSKRKLPISQFFFPISLLTKQQKTYVFLPLFSSFLISSLFSTQSNTPIISKLPSSTCDQYCENGQSLELISLHFCSLNKALIIQTQKEKIKNKKFATLSKLEP